MIIVHGKILKSNLAMMNSSPLQYLQNYSVILKYQTFYMVKWTLSIALFARNVQPLKLMVYGPSNGIKNLCLLMLFKLANCQCFAWFIVST